MISVRLFSQTSAGYTSDLALACALFEWILWTCAKGSFHYLGNHDCFSALKSLLFLTNLVSYFSLFSYLMFLIFLLFLDHVSLNLFANFHYDLWFETWYFRQAFWFSICMEPLICSCQHCLDLFGRCLARRFARWLMILPEGISCCVSMFGDYPGIFRVHRRTTDCWQVPRTQWIQCCLYYWIAIKGVERQGAHQLSQSLFGETSLRSNGSRIKT